MKKLLLGMMACTMLLTGCSTGTSEDDRSLVVYTNSGADGRGDWIVERAKEAGFDLTIVDMGAAELTNRIVAEKNAQIADVVWGLNAVEYEKLKAEDLLQSYKPVWGDDIDINFGDDEGYYWPIVVQPLVLAYNPEFVSEVPTDWTTLATQFPGTYQIHPLGGGTAKTVLASIIARYQDPSGELGISTEGWAVVKEYIQEGYMTVQNEDYWAHVVDGSKPLVMMWGSGLLLNSDKYGIDFEIMIPEIGHPFVVEQLAITKNTKKTDVAKEFIDWMGSAEIQAEFSTLYGTTPAHPEALATSPDNVKELMSKVFPQEIDWKFVAQNIDAWVEKVSLEYVK